MMGIGYRVEMTNPHRHFISFEGKFPAGGKDKLLLQLAAWRPGRYELGNFAKNIRGWKATGDDGKILSYRKISKDLWEVETGNSDTVTVAYMYYGAELNAGSSYLDEDQLYLNPVNCFFYIPDQSSLPYTINFAVPSDYIIASGLENGGKHILKAENFDELADCPLFASATLQNFSYTCRGTVFNIWIQGKVKLNTTRLIAEFEAFTELQVKMFGDIPCDVYHFLFQFTPYFVRHGVEHRNSTVIAMGPASDFQSEMLFRDLLGISCHELFHTWNIKSIRPVEMMPYDFTRENYSSLGYVAEGVTTYYGDLLLWTSGGFSDEDWFSAMSARVQDHIDNPGRFNLSVAESSRDTWLDGYGPGIPWRKVSIYNEGCLVSLLIDLHLISKGTSLDEVMFRLYHEFGKTDTGYSEADYMRLVNEIGGGYTEKIFSELVYSTGDYMPFLKAALESAGVGIAESPSMKFSEGVLGMFLDEGPQKVLVRSVIEGSPADKAGLWNGDEIVAVNGEVTARNIQWLLQGHHGKIELTINSKGVQKRKSIEADGKIHAYRYGLYIIPGMTDQQRKIFTSWKTRQAGN